MKLKVLKFEYECIPKDYGGRAMAGFDIFFRSGFIAMANVRNLKNIFIRS